MPVFLASPSQCWCLSAPMSMCVCPCVCMSCTRLRGDSTPQTAPERTWVARGDTIKVFSLLKGMYPCSQLMRKLWPELVFTNLPFCFLFFLSYFILFPSSNPRSLLALWHFFSIPFFLPVFLFVYSARSVFGVVMRLMRTRFPLLPGSLIWRHCIPAALQSRYNSGSWVFSLVSVLLWPSFFPLYHCKQVFVSKPNFFFFVFPLLVFTLEFSLAKDL